MSRRRAEGCSALKEILRTSLPAVIDLSSQTLMWTVEAILIGQLSASAFAGTAMALQIVILFFTVILTFVVGSSLIISRHIGAGERWEANHILGQALMIGLGVAFLFSLIWYTGAVHLFRLIRQEGTPEARAAGVTYLRTIAFFGPLVITNFIAVGIIRGAGETHYSMAINVFVNGLNLVLAPTLIFGLFGFPRLEVRGAALAVGIAHSCGFMATLWLLRSRRSTLFLSFRELTTPRMTSMRRLFHTGFPTTVEQLATAVVQFVMMSYAARLGVTALAAHGILLRIQGVLSMVYMGFGVGAMSLMGRNLGASDHETAEQTARTANGVVAVMVLGIVGCLVLFSNEIVRLFVGRNQQVVSLGSKVLYVFALVQIPKALGSVLMGHLRGAGDLRWLMWMVIVTGLLIDITTNYVVIFAFGLGLLGLWSVHTLGETVRLLLNVWRFRGGRWKFIDI
ncbi:MAG: MATE family efflux transporter [candidate division KSB1 bacterium]|nr:MATE family efflux transporter [candidate division KSB1 bacterium]